MFSLATETDWIKQSVNKPVSLQKDSEKQDNVIKQRSTEYQLQNSHYFVQCLLLKDEPQKFEADSIAGICDVSDDNTAQTTSCLTTQE